MLTVVAVWSADIIAPQAQVGSVVNTVTDNNTTANLITSPLTSTVNATAPGGYSGGSSVGYNSSTNTYYFGYTQRTIATSIAINNALQGSGVQVNGVQYGMTYLNGADSYGTLSMNVNVTSNTGSTLQTYNHSFNTQNSAWQQFDQTQTFTNPYALANLGNVAMSITGKDSRFWAGYYGPQVKDPYLKLTYGSDPKTYYSIADDGYVPVALPFTFPFYGRNFTQSYFFSNGVVGFLDPTTHWNSFCCDGVNLENNPGSPWHFAIYALQTDLIASNANAKFYTQTDNSSYMKYAWQNINEYGTNNLNTFSTTIKPTGYIGIQHDSINVQYHNVTTGIAGDLSQGQYSQYYNGPGNIFPYTAGSVITFTGTETNLCYSNPLSSPSCPGYAAAYYTQQCSINALYDPSCPGYASAYLNYQCSANPLYSTQCPGYEQAYHDQQCSLNPLYMTDCQGYADAYYVQQCTANPLYDVGCTGYAKAYFDQQCSLNGLYDRLCPNYSSAYATKMVLEQQGTASIVATAGVVAANAPSTSTATVSNDGTVTTSSSTGNATVDKVVAAPTSTTNTAAAPAAPVQLVQAAPAPQQQMARQEPQGEKKPEGGQQAEKKPEGGGQQQASGPQPQGGQQGGEKPQPTNRQALAERRLEAAKQKAVEEGKNLAGTVGNAKDLEAQKAVQGVVVAAMNFVPGFDAYGKAFVPDVIGYKPYSVYNNQKTVDNARLMRGLSGASDRVHEQIVASQYNRGN
jgi:hypothetical protein